MPGLISICMCVCVFWGWFDYYFLSHWERGTEQISLLDRRSWWSCPLLLNKQPVSVVAIIKHSTRRYKVRKKYSTTLTFFFLSICPVVCSLDLTKMKWLLHNVQSFLRWLCSFFPFIFPGYTSQQCHRECSLYLYTLELVFLWERLESFLEVGHWVF